MIQCGYCNVVSQLMGEGYFLLVIECKSKSDICCPDKVFY
jgi:hypothetical protein